MTRSCSRIIIKSSVWPLTGVGTLTLVDPEMLLHQGRLRRPHGNYSLRLE